MKSQKIEQNTENSFNAMNVPAFSPPAIFASESLKRGSFLTYFTKVLMQLIYRKDF